MRESFGRYVVRKTPERDREQIEPGDMYSQNGVYKLRASLTTSLRLKGDVSRAEHHMLVIRVHRWTNIMQEPNNVIAYSTSTKWYCKFLEEEAALVRLVAVCVTSHEPSGRNE